MHRWILLSPCLSAAHDWSQLCPGAASSQKRCCLPVGIKEECTQDTSSILYTVFSNIKVSSISINSNMSQMSVTRGKEKWAGVGKKNGHARKKYVCGLLKIGWGRYVCLGQLYFLLLLLSSSSFNHTTNMITIVLRFIACRKCNLRNLLSVVLFLDSWRVNL